MNPSCFMFLIFRRSTFVRIGLLTLSILQFSAFSSRRFPSAPMYTVVDVTTSSRIASIGGFVTCANNCLKYRTGSDAYPKVPQVVYQYPCSSSFSTVECHIFDRSFYFLIRITKCFLKSLKILWFVGRY